MEFEFDNNKSIANFKKHGIDFIEAQKLWDDTEGIQIPAKFLDEERYVLIAKMKGKLWSAVFTYRYANVRLISVRRARENEREIYEG